jgi:hypothetical protein
MMFKIVGVDKKEYGPVSVEQLRQWLAEGRVDAHTRVRAGDDAEWQPLSTVSEFAADFRRGQPWVCAKCGEKIEPQFDACWRCSTSRGAQPETPRSPAIGAPPLTTTRINWRVEYKMFRGTLATWDELFTRASEFATDIGRDRLIGISHSADRADGVVAVWYWIADHEMEV